MRFVVCVLTCAIGSGVSLALADPPSTPAPAAEAAPAAPATAATPAAPATPSAQTSPAPASASVTVTAEASQIEKHLLSEGYKIEMHNGEKLFCRKEEQLGSRLGGQKSCATAQQLDTTEHQAIHSVDRSMMQQNNPTGH
jgi:hypothetical protein